MHTHKFIKCYLDKLQWVCGEWFAQYLCAYQVQLSMRDYSCPLAQYKRQSENKANKMNIHFTIQNDGERERVAERERVSVKNWK